MILFRKKNLQTNFRMIKLLNFFKSKEKNIVCRIYSTRNTIYRMGHWNTTSQARIVFNVIDSMKNNSNKKYYIRNSNFSVPLSDFFYIKVFQGVLGSMYSFLLYHKITIIARMLSLYVFVWEIATQIQELVL